MKALKTKVILSGIVLMFAFIATIGTTYAWFTVSDTVTVDTLTLNVQSADNLLIKPMNYDEGTDTFSATTPNLVSTYTTSLSQADLVSAGLTNLGSYNIEPVTIINPDYAAFDATSLSYIGDLSDDDRTLTTVVDANVNATDGYYIELQFLLYSQAAVTKAIEFDLPSITTSGATDVANAVRLSVFSTGTYDASDVFQAAAGDWQLFGNNNDYSFDFTGLTGEITDAGETSILTTGEVGFNALTDLATAPTSLNQVSVADGSALSGSVTINSAQPVGTTALNIVEIAPETPTVVSVLIFVEGWNVDADNFIANSQFIISFGFRFGEDI